MNVFNYSSKTPSMGARGQRGSEGFQVVGFLKNHEVKGPEGEYPLGRPIYVRAQFLITEIVIQTIRHDHQCCNQWGTSSRCTKGTPPNKKRIVLSGIGIFYLNFLPTTINICMFFCHHYHHHHHHHYYFNHHCYFISSYMQKRYFWHPKKLTKLPELGGGGLER